MPMITEPLWESSLKDLFLRDLRKIHDHIWNAFALPESLLMPAAPTSRPHPASFAGLRILTNPHLMIRTQVRFPRTKKKRIRKKWAKRSENWRVVPDTTYYRLGDTLIAHPEMIQRLRTAYSRQEDAHAEKWQQPL